MNDPVSLVARRSSTSPPAVETRSLSIAIGIASAGRAAILRQTIDYLARLEPIASRIIICVPDREDAAELEEKNGLEIITSPRGLTTQRNRLLQAAMPDCDVLVFLDDDFVPAPDFLSKLKCAFEASPDVVVATGHVIADGITTGGLSMSYALNAIATDATHDDGITEIYNAYGCNMAVRLAPIIQHGLTFDEKLPLYGWLEDIDFSRAIAPYGRSVMVLGARGVHLGVRTGRQSGLKLGYSQIANPIYLVRKRTMAASRAIALVGRNLLANLWGALMGDGTVDRRGRLLGNLRAAHDLITGRLSPLRILELDPLPERNVPLSAAEARRR